MKKDIVTLLLFLLFTSCFSQNLRYEYRGRFSPAIKKEKLNEARFINQIMPEFCNNLLPYEERTRLCELLKIVAPPYYAYPLGNYIHVQENYEKFIDYVSIEILATCHGKAVSSQSISDAITSEQKNILNTADLGSDIRIKIRFKYKYWVNENLNAGSEIKEGEYVVTVVPETEAEYPGGFKQLSEYLTESVINKIPEKNAFEKIRQAVMKFTVNEEGQIVDAKIFKTSKDPKTDKLLLDAFNKMPKWNPAKNSAGLKVRQQFSIPFGGNGC